MRRVRRYGGPPVRPVAQRWACAGETTGARTRPTWLRRRARCLLRCAAASGRAGPGARPRPGPWRSSAARVRSGGGPGAGRRAPKAGAGRWFRCPGRPPEWSGAWQTGVPGCRHWPEHGLAKTSVHFRFLNVSHWRGKPRSEPGMPPIRYAYILPMDTTLLLVDYLGFTTMRSPTALVSFSVQPVPSPSPQTAPSRGSNGDKPYV